jgi:hypothetical protein
MKRDKVIRVAATIFVLFGLVFTTAAIAATKGPAQTIQGIVEKGEKGITMVKTDDGQAFIILNKNMTEMIGKKVKVTGTLSKGTKTKSIVVTHFEEITE